MRATRVIINIIAFILLSGCNNSKQFNVEDYTTSIAHLKGISFQSLHNITNATVIKGTVVANDLYNEFYRSIVVADNSGAIEIAIDSDDIFKHIPTFASVTVWCQGLTLARIGQNIRLGLYPTGDFPVDGIRISNLSQHIEVNSNPQTIFTPTEKTIDNISFLDLGNYLIIRGITIINQSEGLWCKKIDGEFCDTLHEAIDRAGNSILVEISGKCSYASHSMPNGEIDIAGVIDYVDDRLTIRPTNYDISSTK